MKKITKLNNKGFTLIELLAVIVILAVVMAIASTSVISAMNNSRKSSLEDSAKVAADAFRLAYSEYSLGSSDGTLVGLTTNNTTSLLAGTAQALTSDTLSVLNISENDYDYTKSYVYFDTSKGVFTVCLTAKSTGSFYVASAVKDDDVAAADSPVKKVLAKKTMYACSDNTNSWTSTS